MSAQDPAPFTGEAPTSALGESTPARYATISTSFHLQQAAQNLLLKALRAVRDGDHARARSLSARALGLPNDEHEGVAPAWWAATVLLDGAVNEELEACDPDDDTWLRACEQVLHTAAEAGAGAQTGAGAEAGTGALRAAIAVAAVDHDLPRAEAHRCRTTSTGANLDAWLDQSPPEHKQALEAVLAIVCTTAACRAPAPSTTGAASPNRAGPGWTWSRRSAARSEGTAAGSCSKPVPSVHHRGHRAHPDQEVAERARLHVHGEAVLHALHVPGHAGFGHLHAAPTQVRGQGGGQVLAGPQG
ncbi:hypothetical protein [Kineococcus sp. SYSU DK005]|uniref:hypothetical protein n=1 Tax=Kineococcus sp. SYSU DK005 TaxID=3383126 RepID=UPI003D7CEF8B